MDETYKIVFLTCIVLALIQLTIYYDALKSTTKLSQLPKKTKAASRFKSFFRTRGKARRLCYVHIVRDVKPGEFALIDMNNCELCKKEFDNPKGAA